MSIAKLCDRNFPHTPIPVNYTSEFQELWSYYAYETENWLGKTLSATDR
jgi:hypothetical protein